MENQTDPKFASYHRIMPEVVAEILSDSFRRNKVLLQCDASDVLRDAFAQTEERISHYYEVYSQHSLCYIYSC